MFFWGSGLKQEDERSVSRESGQGGGETHVLQHSAHQIDRLLGFVDKLLFGSFDLETGLLLLRSSSDVLQVGSASVEGDPSEIKAQCQREEARFWAKESN